MEAKMNEDDDPIAPARGVALGLLIVIPLWALIGCAIWYVTH